MRSAKLGRGVLRVGTRIVPRKKAGPKFPEKVCREKSFTKISEKISRTFYRKKLKKI